MRARSLFWTFAGVFLLVVAAAAVFQVVVSVAVLRPMSAQAARDRARTAMDDVAKRVAALPDSFAMDDLADALHQHAPLDRGQVLLIGVTDGPVMHDRPLLPEMHRGVVA